MKNSVTCGFTPVLWRANRSISGIDQRGVSVFDVGDSLGRVKHSADLAEALHHPVGELGILNEFLTISPFRDATEAAHPLRDVRLKPDAPLFAIIDDIDTGFRLLLQHVRDAQVDAGLQRAVLDWLAGLLVDQHLAERRAVCCPHA